VQQVFRSTLGRVLTGGLAVLAAVAVVVLLAREPVELLRALPWLALVVGACWALFWRPCVVVDDGGVHIVNPLRTIDLPWPSIVAVDTKWALKLVTAYGSYTAWAAPAPGARHTAMAARGETKHLPRSAVSAGGIRPGDLPSSASGNAALIIRRRWEQLRDAGHLEDPRLEHAAAPVHWHVGIVAVGAVLLVAAVVALAV
jgi:hypothetical protein